MKGFKNHPFKVETNRELFELMQSIERDGILVPLLARPSPDGNGYELISGHRRKAACEWEGKTEVPVIICDMDDNQATIAMVNSNLQREHVKPSEKAFGCYEKARYENGFNFLPSWQMQRKAIVHFVEAWKIHPPRMFFQYRFPTQVFFSADGTPYVPCDELAQEIKFTMYYSKVIVTKK